ncbi:SHOCT domain-containing protein [Sphingomonas sp. S17]|uniref:SHOCT domain-containing protein n=1 Tax=Sphingomonas sp. S17 TaxID=1007104 RepID=UPI001ED8EC46|nr:SHOCT domain-containing protein [Sphingomonas sp. S17]
MSYVIMAGLCAAFSAVLAEGRGRSSDLWLILGLLFGPITLLIIACLPRESPPKRADHIPEQTAPATTADEIAKLMDLKDRGALTDAEFAQQKAKLLG